MTIITKAIHAILAEIIMKAAIIFLVKLISGQTSKKQ